MPKYVLVFNTAQLCPSCPNWPPSDLFSLLKILEFLVRRILSRKWPSAHALMRLVRHFCLFEYSCPMELEQYYIVKMLHIYVALTNCAWFEVEGLSESYPLTLVSYDFR